MKLKESQEYVVAIRYTTMENEVCSDVNYFSSESNAVGFIEAEEEGLAEGLGILLKEFTIWGFNIKTGERICFSRKEADEDKINTYQSMKKLLTDLFKDILNEDD